jgi:ABC-type amino acid transport substrate-binding protein
MKYLRIFLVFTLFCLVGNSFAKPLIIGTIPYAPPFEVKNKDNTFFGFEIDMMRAICLEMKTDCIFKVHAFNELFSALNSKTIDLAIASIIISPERRQQVLFSLPYLINYHQFVTLMNSPIHNISQLEGKRVGIYQGSPEIGYVRKKFNGKINIVLYKDVNALLTALKAHAVEAIVLEVERAAYWKIESQELSLLGSPFRLGDGYGIAAKLGNGLLIQRVNQALRTIESNGVYLSLYKHYYGFTPIQ